MKSPLQIRTIDSFRECADLLHAFSPRSFENVKGVSEDLLLGRLNDPNTSLQHRQMFLDRLSISSKNIFMVKQVHGDRVFVLDDAKWSPEKVELEEADALITHLTGTPVAVLTADCVPVILYDPKAHAVGVVHAGRKGTQAALVSKTLSMLSEVYGSRIEDVRMALGPAIGGCCYEVDRTCVEPFKSHYPEWESFVTAQSNGKFRLDLLQANVADGQRAGIRKENIHLSGECTSCNNDRWYSYRREGTTGRIVTLAMLL